MPDFPTIRNTDRFVLSPASPHSTGVVIGGTGSGNVTGGFPTNNLAFYIPVSVHSAIVIAKLFWKNGGTLAGSVDAGIYDAGGTAIVRAGGVAQAGTSLFQEVDIADTTLNPGLYYLAISCSTTSAQFVRYGLNTIFAKSLGVCTQASAYPLPAAATFATPSSGNFPVICATQRTLV
jgi:hypothetical protein